MRLKGIQTGEGQSPGTYLIVCCIEFSGPTTIDNQCVYPKCHRSLSVDELLEDLDKITQMAADSIERAGQ